jgi:hypothetical protein
MRYQMRLPRMIEGLLLLVVEGDAVQLQLAACPCASST